MAIPAALQAPSRQNKIFPMGKKTSMATAGNKLEIHLSLSVDRFCKGLKVAGGANKPPPGPGWQAQSGEPA